jgi:hypothetical protein
LSAFFSIFSMQLSCVTLKIMRSHNTALYVNMCCASGSCRSFMLCFSLSNLTPIASIAVSDLSFIKFLRIQGIFFSGSAAQRELWPSRPRGFLITHNDVPQSVGLLWTSDQLVAETST